MFPKAFGRVKYIEPTPRFEKGNMLYTQKIPSKFLKNPYIYLVHIFTIRFFVGVALLVFSRVVVMSQDSILLFVAHENTYYSEYIVMYAALTDAGYYVDVRSARQSQDASTYMIPANTTIDATAATLPGGSYAQFTAQYQAYFGQAWNPAYNPTPMFIQTQGSLLDVENMDDYKALIVVGGTGAQAYNVDGNYSAQGSGQRMVPADSIRQIAEKLNALAIEALTQGKPVVGQCHGAGVPAHWRYPVPENAGPGDLGTPILQGSIATGFPEAATANTLSALGISYRANDPVVIGHPHENVMDNGHGDYRIVTTRDWYPQTIAHAARTVINMIESYHLPEVFEDTVRVLILHGGAVDPDNCHYTNRSNDIPCNYGNLPQNLPADYTHLLALLQGDSDVDQYIFDVDDAHLTVNVPFDANDFCDVFRYIQPYDVVIFYKHWSTGVTVALQNALVSYADNGGSVLSLHHGLYNDNDPSGLNKNIIANQLFTAHSAAAGWSANRTNYQLFQTNYGHFITTFGITNHLTSLQAPSAWNSNPLPLAANTGYSYYQRFSVFDEIYNNTTYLNSPVFGRGVNQITPLLSNNLTPAGQCHVSGFFRFFDQNADNIVGKVLYFQIGETRANYEITHAYGQMIRNATAWCGRDVNAAFPKKTWSTAVNGEWSDPARWSPVGIPRSCDEVVLPDFGNGYNVNVNGGEYEVKSVLAEEGANLILWSPNGLIIKN